MIAINKKTGKKIVSAVERVSCTTEINEDSFFQLTEGGLSWTVASEHVDWDNAEIDCYEDEDGDEVYKEDIVLVTKEEYDQK